MFQKGKPFFYSVGPDNKKQPEAAMVERGMLFYI